MRLVAACLLLGGPLLALAADDWDVMRKAAVAARNQPLVGTYTHQVGGEMETFRLYRLSEGGVVRERRESLDGAPREIVRVDGELTCYAPDAKALNAAKLHAIKLFPALLPEAMNDLPAGYALVRGSADRVAQQDCQWWTLKPKDGSLRYSQRFCLDPDTAMPLKAVTLGVRGEVIEQFAFTELQQQAPRDKELLRPRNKQSLSLGKLTALPAAVSAMPVDIKGLPAGFRLVRYVNRNMPGHEKAVQHYVYSDGFAKLSLFVEDSSGEPVAHPAVVAPNGIGVVSRQTGEQLLTVVGDLPEAGLQAVLKNVRITPRQP